MGKSKKQQPVTGSLTQKSPKFHPELSTSSGQTLINNLILNTILKKENTYEMVIIAHKSILTMILQKLNFKTSNESTMDQQENLLYIIKENKENLTPNCFQLITQFNRKRNDLVHNPPVKILRKDTKYFENIITKIFKEIDNMPSHLTSSSDKATLKTTLPKYQESDVDLSKQLVSKTA
jgi:hypothetical protein